MFNSPARGEENSCANTMFHMSRERRALTPEELADAKRLQTIWLQKKKPLGLTQEQIAADCDWTQGAFGHYLHGRVALNLEAVLKIARVLKVRPDEISPRLTMLLTDEAHSVHARDADAGYNKELKEWIRLGERYLKLGLIGTARRAAENTIEAVLMERGATGGNVPSEKALRSAGRIQDHPLGATRKKIAR